MTTPRIIGFAPDPNMEWGLYHYACQCPVCNWRSESDKGMLGPERDYEKHWLKDHNNNKEE